MTLTLYRKYRPQNFKSLIGQNHIKVTIQNELETGKIAHAYLFSGPRGVGKTTVARLIAKSVNCLNRKKDESEPCDKCDSCREFLAGKSLDIIEIDAASHTGVDNVRENIINNSRFTPTSRKFKVFIIDEVHMLSISSFNALLKTLEEPPSHVIFILATTEIYKVPQTIISRCQHFEFRKVSQQEIIKRLNQIVGSEKKIVPNEILESVAYYSEGCIRDSESLLGQILSLGEKEITIEQAELVLPRSNFYIVLKLAEYLVKKDPALSISLINQLVEDGISMEKFTSDVIEVLRKMILIKISNQLDEFSVGFNDDLQKKISELSSIFNLNFLIKTLDIFIKRSRELKFSNIIQLPLELAVLEIICDDSNEPDRFFKKSNAAEDDINEHKSNKDTIPEDKTVLNKLKPQKTISRVKLSIGQVKDKWQEVLICLRKYNHSLASTLKISQPSVINEDGTLEICLMHKFHQQRINDLKNKQLLEKVLQDIFGIQLFVKTVVVKELPDKNMQIEALAESKNEQGSLDNILQTFGGQLVE